ncbi:hypothetical protein Pint_11437 [Pistacia integerrima]|uniref:Uncharacterized protein n=1 Tax=Pistacia integerrima TaxID=434235 RepID=A0ACC0XGP0_9ROSI|nr:hypothetical protein Pint_11437 [Pistacia integerrima]
MAFCIASTCNIPSGAIFQHRQLLVSKTPTSRISVKKQLQCIANPELSTSTVLRRSGNYKPCIFNEDYLPKLTNEYTVVMNILDRVQNISDHKWKKGNLYATSLEFRLLRQHGYYVTEEVFESFRDKTGSFSACVGDGMKAILSFYEASFYGLEGESMIQEAWEFSSKHLKDLDDKDVDQNLAPLVEHALELPLHCLQRRNFNILQGIHQEELKDTLRSGVKLICFSFACEGWWEITGLRELTLLGTSLITAYLWGLGIAFQPQYPYCRKFVAKAIALITVIDDIYDVYGTLPELELLTDAITRWDIKAMKQLPSYMKTSFLSPFNFVNEVAYHILKEKNSDVSMTLIKMEVAREYIKDLTRKIWKKINGYRTATNCPLPQPIVEMIINLVRTSHYFYRHGDGHGGGGPRD